MNKVYQLKQDLENYAHFIEQRGKYEDSFSYKYWGLKKIDLNNYKPLILKLYASDTGKKNFQTDISYISGASFAFSENAIKVFKEIFEKTGQIFPVQTESKRKKFFGFYPNKKPYDGSIINFDKSVWRQADKGKLIKNLVLNNKYPKDDYLFTLYDHPSYVYVTESFKKLVEDNNLKGFDFSKEIKIED